MTLRGVSFAPRVPVFFRSQGCQIWSNKKTENLNPLFQRVGKQLRKTKDPFGNPKIYQKIKELSQGKETLVWRLHLVGLQLSFLNPQPNKPPLQSSRYGWLV